MLGVWTVAAAHNPATTPWPAVTPTAGRVPWCSAHSWALPKNPYPSEPQVAPGTVGPAVKVREVIKLLEQDGWRLDRQSGSHRQYRHPSKAGTVTVAGNLGGELKPGTLASVLRQAGLRGQRP